MMYRKKHIRGVSLLEVLIGAAIISLVLIGSVSTLHFYTISSRLNLERVQAAYLLEEGVEAARSLRDTDWSTFSSLLEDVPHYLVFENSSWTATTTQSLFDNRFEQTVTFSPVYRRNSDDDIVASTSSDAKTLDLNTREVTVSVVWGQGEKIDIAFETGTTTADLANFPADNTGDGDPAQRFTTSNEAVTVSSVALPLMRAPGESPSPVYLEIRSDSTIGTLIATSSTVTVDAISENDLSWVTFSFSTPPALTALTSYYLRLRSLPDSTIAFSGSAGTLYWGYEQASPSLYTEGEAHRYVGRLENENDAGQVLSQYDFSFRVLSVATLYRLDAVTYLSNLFSN